MSDDRLMDEPRSHARIQALPYISSGGIIHVNKANAPTSKGNLWKEKKRYNGSLRAGTISERRVYFSTVTVNDRVEEEYEILVSQCLQKTKVLR